MSEGGGGRWVWYVWGLRDGGGEVVCACAGSRGPGRKFSEVREGGYQAL